MEVPVIDKNGYFIHPSERIVMPLQGFHIPNPIGQHNLPKMETHIPQHQPSTQPTSSTATAQQSNEGILAPQKVRTERYVKVSLKGVVAAAQKPLYMSWFLDNNGLPDAGLLLIPERHPNVIINFKTTHGWVEVETKGCIAPDFEIQFELKLHHATLNMRRYSQSHQPVVLRFFLLEKREDGMMVNLGEVLLSLLLMSSKCPNRTLIAHLVNQSEEKPEPPIREQYPSMSVPVNMHMPTSYPLPMPLNDPMPRKYFMAPEETHYQTPFFQNWPKLS